MEIAVKAEKESSKKTPDEYEIKCWYDDIMRGEAVKKDDKKMAYVKKYAEKQKLALDELMAIPTKAKVKDIDSLRKAGQDYEE